MPVAYADLPLSRDELACVYAALILADDDVPVTTDKITTILRAADIEVEPIWPALFARALEGVDVKQLVSTLQGSAAVTAAAGVAAEKPTQVAGTSTEQNAEEKNPEPEESSDEDFGFGLFD